MSNIEIIYEDDYLIAVNKAHGDLIHASPIARDAPGNIKDVLSAIKGFNCFPLHRLDRKTSGVCLFSKDKRFNASFQTLFDEKLIYKAYYSIVRGYTIESGTIDYSLTNDRGKLQEAVSHYKTMDQGEINYAFNNFETIRYSMVQIVPETGRFHQIRKHFAHIFHPIIGDRPHGCNKQNKLWKEVFGIPEMLLHAYSLNFIHPFTKEQIALQANFSSAFNEAFKLIFNNKEIKLR
jgi:tRNA pseudouridine65 synthase